MSNIINKVLPQEGIAQLLERFREAGDTQSVELLYDVYSALREELQVSSGAEEAFNRIEGMVSRGQSWDPALLRNNVFKAANSLGIKLPSGMF